jgi:predicted GNAT family acetyltransferase
MESKERREEKRLSERERKEMREDMWEMEEEGGGDVVIPLIHHVYELARTYSRQIVDVCGYVVETEEEEDYDEDD